MNHSEIFAKLINRLTTTLPIAYPGISFDPPNDGHYVVIQLLPGVNAQPELSGVERSGIIQITVVDRTNIGQFRAMRAAEDIAEDYAKQPTAQDGIHLTSEPNMLPPFQDGDQLRIPMQISYIVR